MGGSLMDGDNWPHYRERITVVDVLDSGACMEGVQDWLIRNRRQIAGPTEDHVGNEYIAAASHSNGDGNGDGDGDGDGYGNGYGYGYGDGDGDGDGYGYGDGYGDGDGNGGSENQ
jgi:hypothetical protein